MNAAINAHELNWVELTSVELVEMSLNRIETYSEQGRSSKEKRTCTGRFRLLTKPRHKPGFLYNWAC